MAVEGVGFPVGEQRALEIQVVVENQEDTSGKAEYPVDVTEEEVGVDSGADTAEVAGLSAPGGAAEDSDFD